MGTEHCWALGAGSTQQAPAAGSHWPLLGTRSEALAETGYLWPPSTDYRNYSKSPTYEVSTYKLSQIRINLWDPEVGLRCLFICMKDQWRFFSLMGQQGSSSQGLSATWLNPRESCSAGLRLEVSDAHGTIST